MGMAQDFDAVDMGHLDVGNDDVVESAVNFTLGGFTAIHGFDFVAIATKSDIQEFADGPLVIADQDLTHVRRLSLRRQPRPRSRWRWHEVSRPALVFVPRKCPRGADAEQTCTLAQ